MAKIILPSVPVVAPTPTPFHLGDEEYALFDMITEEHVGMVGTPIEYFALDRAASQKDPLYNEASERVYQGPFRMMAHLSDPQDTTEIRDEGIRNSWDASIWIPRKSLEDARCPWPNEGDVVRVWRGPLHDDIVASGSWDAVPGQVFAFDCIEVHEEGHLFDNPSFTGFKIDIKRRSEFTPERRIDGVA